MAIQDVAGRVAAKGVFVDTKSGIVESDPWMASLVDVGGAVYQSRAHFHDIPIEGEGLHGQRLAAAPRHWIAELAEKGVGLGDVDVKIHAKFSEKRTSKGDDVGTAARDGKLSEC